MHYDFWSVVHHSRRLGFPSVLLKVTTRFFERNRSAVVKCLKQFFCSTIFFAYMAVERDASHYIKLLRKEPEHGVYSLFDPKTVNSQNNIYFVFSELILC